MFIATSMPDFVYKRHRLKVEKEVEPIRKLLEEMRFEEAVSSCPDKLIDAFSVSGSPEYCVELMQEILGKGVLTCPRH